MRARTRHTRSTVVDSDDSQSESDGSEARENGFFDDEALESAESTDEESGSEEEEIDPFPFTRLPPELRLRVWTLFCPDLEGTPRVLDFNVHDSLSPKRKSPCRVIGAGLCLEDQTRALRCVLATSQQSRAIAKERFPDELRLESDDGEEFTLCVNLHTDVAMLDRVPNFAREETILGLPTIPVSLDGFSQSLLSLALPLHDANLYEQNTDVTSWLRKFRSLQRIFLYTDEDNFGERKLKDDALRWCASSHARQYYMETFEKEPGYGEDYTKLVCWPDSDKSPFFTATHVPNWHTKYLFQTQETAFEEAGVQLYPMVIFQTELGLERYDNFVATDYLPLKVYGANEEEDSEAESYEEDLDEDYQVNDTSAVADGYESDGIDDEEPEIFHESGDEHLDDGESDEESAAQNPFSSPEPSEDEGRPSQRGRKRRVVADSDDEDDNEPSHRPVKRKRTHIIDDSDEEAGAAGATDAQVISSDDDEDEAPTKRRRVQLVESGESESDDDGDEPQRRTLEDRLQIRSRRRPTLSDEDDSEEEEDDLDDDEEDSDDVEEGFIDSMAADSDEEEGDEDDEEGE
ncbi:hypothetical protein PWT90_03182 [Aphanocladium album]|nr:hypothetical protein PWT90_03182 [Aphanocladium album]